MASRLDYFNNEVRDKESREMLPVLNFVFKFKYNIYNNNNLELVYIIFYFVFIAL